LLKYFPGETEIWGAIVIPSLVFGVIALMPFLGKWKLGHRFNLGFLGCLLAGAGLLTFAALREDQHNPTYLTSVKRAEVVAARVRELAKAPAGIPAEGAVALLRNDPLTQGPKIFSAQCAGCHRFGGEDGTGKIPNNVQSASDLKGFASREWLAGLLDPARIGTTNYFGATKFKTGKMARFVHEKVAAYPPEKRANLPAVIAALSAEAQLTSQLAADQRDAAIIATGRGWLKDEFACTDCHQFHAKDEDATAPELTGYGSRKWLVNFITNPAHADFYGERNERMPLYGEKQILTGQQINLVADWLRGVWYEPAK